MADTQAVAPAPAITALYTVQGPHTTSTAAKGIVNGREMLVSVDAFEVELVADDRVNGSVKLRFLGDDIEAAKNLFLADSKVVASFAAEG